MTRTFGPSICHALPGYHAFTGCDFTASFANKGKVRPFNILKKNITYQKTFAELASATDNHYKNIYKFTAEMYGLKNCTNIDEARYSLFCRLTSPKKQRKLLDDIKHLDAAMLPPCKTVLDLKVKRCEYITKIWKHAGQCNPIGNLKPEDYGWVVSEGHLVPQWNSQSYIPDALEYAEDENPDELEGEEDEEDMQQSSSDDSDIESE